MIVTPYIAILAAIRLGLLLVVLAALYGGWLIVAEIVADRLARRRERIQERLS